MRATLIAMVGVVACAPITTTTRAIDTPRPSRTARSAPTAVAELQLAPTAEGFSAVATDSLTCAERHIAVVHRVERTHRHVNVPVTVLEYVVGVGLAGAGAWAVSDPQGAIDASGRSNVTTDSVRVAGAGAIGLGAIVLTFAIVNSVRGGDETRDLGDHEEPGTAGAPTACGTRPHPGDSVALAIADHTWVLGTTGPDGSLAVAWKAIPDDAFDGDWKTARVVVGSASASIDLTAARGLAADRAWAAIAAAPTYDAIKKYRVRFAGVGANAAAADAMAADLADKDLGGAAREALARADLPGAKQAIATWKAEAPASAKVIEAEAEVSLLEKKGPADYLYARYEGAIVDPARYPVAERALVELARVAPKDKRLAAASRQLAQKRAAVAAAQPKPDQARLAAEAKARADADKAEKARLAAEAKAKADADKAEKTRLAAEAKTKADEDKAAAARIVAESKAKADADAAEKARVAAEDKARLAEEAKAKAADANAAAAAKLDAERAEKERIAAEAKAKSEADKAKAVGDARAKADEKARLAADARAKADVERAEKARLAADAKAKADAEREKARLAAAAERARAEERAHATSSRPMPRPGDRDTLPGLWAAVIGDSVWLVELHADNRGRTAIWRDGQIVALAKITWVGGGTELQLATGASSLRGPLVAYEDELEWAGVKWHRQSRGSTAWNPIQ